MERKVIKLELEYLEEIKEDVKAMINTMINNKEKFKTGVAWVIHENDLYMSDKKPIEQACHYVAIGAYAVDTNNITEIEEKVLKKIKESINVIESGKYDVNFTDEDKKYIYEDIERIKNSELLN